MSQKRNKPQYFNSARAKGKFRSRNVAPIDDNAEEEVSPRALPLKGEKVITPEQLVANLDMEYLKELKEALKSIDS